MRILRRILRQVWHRPERTLEDFIADAMRAAAVAEIETLLGYAQVS